MAGSDEGYEGHEDNEGGYEAASAYGGHPLSQVRDLPDEVRSKLEELGYMDAEQVLAAAAVPEVAPYLSETLGLEVGELVERLRETVGETAVMMAEAPMPGSFALGVLPPTDEILEQISALSQEMPMTAFEAAALPGSVNHALKMPPIRQQGGRGTCVGFAMTAVHEFYRSQSGTPQDFSEQFLYHQTKLIDGSGGCGTWAVKAAQVLTNTGEARESVWPYNPNPPCNNNGVRPANALADAAGFKVQPIVLNPKDVNAIKSALASGCVCEVSVPVYNSWYQSAATRQTGRITMRVGSEPQAGGHAMCAIGYQDDSTAPGGGFFILRNSWGTAWASLSPYGAGNGTIPYAYIANEGWEAVTTPVPKRRRPSWWDIFRERLPIFGEGAEEGDNRESGGRRTIIIDARDADIIIR